MLCNKFTLALFAFTFFGMATLSYPQGANEGYPEAVSLHNSNQYDSAKSVVEQLLVRQPPKPGISRCNLLQLLLRINNALGNYDAADSCATVLIESVNTSSDITVADKCRFEIEVATYYRTVGRYPQAVALLRSALQKVDSQNDADIPLYLDVNSSIVELMTAMGKLQEAQSLLMYVIAGREKILPARAYDAKLFSDCSLLGYLLTKQGDYSRADSAYRILVSKRGSPQLSDESISSYYNNWATLWVLQGEYKQAELLLERSVNYLSNKAKLTPRRIRTDVNFAYLYLLWGKTQQSDSLIHQIFAYDKETLQSALPHFTEAERGNFLSTMDSHFDLFLTSLAEKSVTDSTDINFFIRISQFKKALILRTMRQQIAQTKPKGDLGVKAGNQLPKVPSFGKMLQETDIDLPAIQRTLKAGDAVVDVLRFHYKPGICKDSVYYVVLVVTKDAAVLRVLWNGNSLEDVGIRNYIQSVIYNTTDTLSYNYFWRPLLVPQSIRHVYFLPDGVYHNINIATISIPGTNNYLADRFTFYNFQNISQVINAAGDSKLTLGSATLIGNCDFAGTAKRNAHVIKPLPGTKAEIELIRGQLAKKKIKTGVLTGNTATELNFSKHSQSTLLHFATHGYYIDDPDEYPDSKIIGMSKIALKKNVLLRTGIFLAGVDQAVLGKYNGDSNNDGILTSQEISSLELSDCKLAVLSSCESALGKTRDGEGVYGLQRAFSIAGAKNMVMSLWKVDDTATKDFMAIFYSQLLSVNNIQTALTNSYGLMRKKYPEPYYWGAFIGMKLSDN